MSFPDCNVLLVKLHTRTTDYRANRIRGAAQNTAVALPGVLTLDLVLFSLFASRCMPTSKNAADSKKLSGRPFGASGTSKTLS
jgi:hypothetical protein